MNNRFYYFFYAALLALPGSSYADPIITFFLRPCISYNAEKKTCCVPPRISTKMFKKLLTTPPHVQGVFCSYFGYLATANRDGQVTFPRKKRAAKFNILVTQMIHPIMMIGTTVHHWELLPNTPYAYYSVERTQDETTKKYCWLVSKKDFPANNSINLDTITIFAKPSSIIIHEGRFPTKNMPNLYLPDIFVRNYKGFMHEALRVLNIKNFFSPIEKETKEQLPTYRSSHIIIS
jgi:hypothetical protein